MDILQLDNELNAFIVQGKSVAAFEKFYAVDVVAQENDEPERHGRAEWMRARQEMEKSITKFDARVLANATSGDVSFSEWEYHIEFEGGNAMRIAQVAVRRWQNGRVVRERFYHK